MAKGNQVAPSTKFEQTLQASAQLPGVQINREAFLRRELKRYCTDEQIKLAIATTPAEAGVTPQVIDKIANLDMDEIEELAETVGISLYTLRLTDPAFSRLIQMPRDAKSTYAEATLVSNGRVGTTFP